MAKGEDPRFPEPEPPDRPDPSVPLHGPVLPDSWRAFFRRKIGWPFNQKPVDGEGR